MFVKELPLKVEVYGACLSPWVQAVLLTLHEQGTEYEFRQLAPLEKFLRWGVYMPGGDWTAASTEVSYCFTCSRYSTSLS